MDREYEVRIEIKKGSGALYSLHERGAANWKSLYNSNNDTLSSFRVGADVYTGRTCVVVDGEGDGPSLKDGDGDHGAKATAYDFEVIYEEFAWGQTDFTDEKGGSWRYTWKFRHGQFGGPVDSHKLYSGRGGTRHRGLPPRAVYTRRDHPAVINAPLCSSRK